MNNAELLVIAMAQQCEDVILAWDKTDAELQKVRSHVAANRNEMSNAR